MKLKGSMETRQAFSRYSGLSLLVVDQSAMIDRFLVSTFAVG